MKALFNFHLKVNFLITLFFFVILETKEFEVKI